MRAAIATSPSCCFVVPNWCMWRAAAIAYDEIGRSGLYGASHGEDRELDCSLPAAAALVAAVGDQRNVALAGRERERRDRVAWIWNDEPPVRQLSLKRVRMPRYSAKLRPDSDSSMTTQNSAVDVARLQAGLRPAP